MKPYIKPMLDWSRTKCNTRKPMHFKYMYPGSFLALVILFFQDLIVQMVRGIELL